MKQYQKLFFVFTKYVVGSIPAKATNPESGFIVYCYKKNAILKGIVFFFVEIYLELSKIIVIFGLRDKE
jgi:hypothetical protein